MNALLFDVIVAVLVGYFIGLMIMAYPLSELVRGMKTNPRTHSRCRVAALISLVGVALIIGGAVW